MFLRNSLSSFSSFSFGSQPEVGTSAPESAPPLRAEHQFRSGMQRAEHAKKNGAE